MFNIITKFYNMLGEIIGYGNIKKKKCNKMHGGYTANDEKSDDFDNINANFFYSASTAILKSIISLDKNLDRINPK